MNFTNTSAFKAMFYSFMILTAVSCSSAKTDETGNNDTTVAVNTDTAAVLSPELEALLPLFKDAALPYIVDTVVLNHAREHDSLGTSHIRILAGNYVKHDLTNGTEYELDNFYEIDSVKAKKGFEKWAEGLDIGQTKYSNAYALNKLKLDDETWVLVWALAASSYEACPYFSETNIYFSVVYKGKVTETFIAGETVSAGDPPLSMDRNVYGKFTADGKLTVEVEEINDEDMDEPEISITKEWYEFGIKEGKITILKEKKDKPKQVKRPVQDTEE